VSHFIRGEVFGIFPLDHALSLNAAIQSAKGEYVERKWILEVERTRPPDGSNQQGKWQIHCQKESSF
jgi:hypothetical protein